MSSLSLTPEQLAVIEAPITNCVVTAVAGSGKTTTLAHRIQYLLSQGFEAQRILILMFNRSAKEDFVSKLGNIVPQSMRVPEVRTFHSMGYRLYQRFIRDGSLPPIDMRVMSEKETHLQIWRLINQVLTGESLKSAKRNKKDYIEAAHHFIESVKNSLQAPDITFEALRLSDKFRFVLEVFERFEQWRKDNKRIGYTDMLYDPVLAIRNDPRLQQLVQDKMDIILVDEYQDTNDLQHVLLKYIAGTRAKVTVVGDPDQTIYEFRGAKPEYIIKGFSEEFGEASTLTLSHSFRYGHQVSLLANHLIQHNRERLPILCKSHESTPLTKVEAIHGTDECAEICQRLMSGYIAFDRTAILARVWSQLAPIELALTQFKIPYHIEGNKSVFSSVETQSLITLLEIATREFSKHDEITKLEKLKLLMRFPHVGLGDSQIHQLAHLLSRLPDGWGKALLSMVPEELHRIQKIKLERLGHALINLEKEPNILKHALNTYAVDTDLFESIRNMSLSHEHAEEKVSLVKGIFNYLIKQCSTVKEGLFFLYELCARQSQVDQQNAKVSNFNQVPNLNKASNLNQGSKQAVLLTSIHRAKGLEWDNVLIPGIRADIMPYSYKEQSIQAELESERRLLYVAMTRARARLFLMLPAKTERGIHQRSRFEKELHIDASVSYGQYFGKELTEDKVSVRATKLIEQYTQQIGFGRLSINSLTDNSQTDKDSEDRSFADAIWEASRVEHSILGKGDITGHSKTAFSVQFENDEERTFSKELADRFFTVLEN